MEIIEELEKLLLDVENYWEEISFKTNLICYGAGKKGIQTEEILSKKGVKIAAFCDNNINLIGGSINQIPIMSYDDVKLSYKKREFIISTTIRYALEIYNFLKEHGEENPVYFIANPFKVENKFLNAYDVRKNIGNYQMVSELLQDDESKKIFYSFIYWKMTGDLRPLLSFTTAIGISEFFDSEILPWAGGTYVDVGAFTGDSIVRFIGYSKGIYDKIYAIEPDEKNFSNLIKFIEYSRLSSVIPINKGLWSSCEKREFFSTPSELDYYESSNFFKRTELLASSEMLNPERNLSSGNLILTSTLDELFCLNERIDLIKIDALASEVAILHGGKKIISNQNPNLIMEFGTHSEFLLDQILFLNSINPNYLFYLRQKSSFGNSRTVLLVKNRQVNRASISSPTFSCHPAVDD